MIRAVAIGALLSLGLVIQTPPSGVIAGTARQPDGSVLPGVTITATESDGREYSTAANSQGRFRLEGLPPGTYRVNGTLSGFEPTTIIIVVTRERATDVTVVLRITPWPVPDPPEFFIHTWTGPNPRACGKLAVHAAESDVQASISCAMAASRRPESFVVIRAWNGTDSNLAEGLLGRPDGAIFKFSYDSAPCGSPACLAQFTLERCEVPTTSLSQSRVEFGCARAKRETGSPKSRYDSNRQRRLP